MVIKCLAMCLFVALAIICFIVPGFDFSGGVCVGIAAVIGCYLLLKLLARDHAIAAKILKTVLTTGLIIGIAVIGVTECFIFGGAKGDTQTSVDYVIVLGAGIRGSQPSLILQSRIEAAYEYLSAHPDAVCIASGGQGEDEDLSEAQCIYDHLTAKGIDGGRIWLEDQSTTTWENFNLTLALIEEKTGARPEKMGVISNEFHLYRAGLIANKCGVEAVGIPAQTPWLSLKVNYFLREAAALWKFLIFGG